MKLLSKCQDSPTNLPDGRVIENYKPIPNMNVVGTIITFECNEGYKLTSQNTVYFCLKMELGIMIFHI